MLRFHMATLSWQFVRNDEIVCGLMAINASEKVCPWHEIRFLLHQRRECGFCLVLAVQLGGWVSDPLSLPT